MYIDMLVSWLNHNSVIKENIELVETNVNFIKSKPELFLWGFLIDLF